jgi:hypothetical protein
VPSASAPRWLGVALIDAEAIIPMTPSKRMVVAGGLELNPYHDPSRATLDHRGGTTLRATLVLSNELSLAARARWHLLIRGAGGRWQPARPGQTQHVGQLRAEVTYVVLGTFDVNFGLQGSRRSRAPISPTDENMVRNELFVFASVNGSFALIEARAAARTPDDG